MKLHFSGISKIACALPVLVLALGCGKTDPKGPVLATVGDRSITQAEFVHRAEFSYLPPAESEGGYSKGQLLELLINEKLMALAAEELGLDSNQDFQRANGFAEELALAREHYLEQVRGKVQIDQRDIDATAGKMSQARTVAFLLFADRKGAEFARNRLLAGEAFNDILLDIRGLAADTSGSRMKITWGEGEFTLDEAIYDLKSIGDVSQVVPTSRGFTVLVLENIERSVIGTQSGHQDLLHRAETILRARRESQRSGEYVADFMKDKAVELDRDVFPEFAGAVLSQFELNHQGPMKEESFNILEPGKFDLINRALTDRLDRVLLRFRGGGWTVADVMERWRLCNLPLNLSSARACRRSLVRNMSIMIRDKFLADEGRRRGYAKRPSVHNEVAMWKDHFLYALHKHNLLEAKGEEQLNWPDYLHQLKMKYAVKVDSHLLENLELTGLQSLAVRPGQYGSLVVPMWPIF